MKNSKSLWSAAHLDVLILYVGMSVLSSLWHNCQVGTESRRMTFYLAVALESEDTDLV